MKQGIWELKHIFEIETTGRCLPSSRTVGVGKNHFKFYINIYYEKYN